MLTLIADSNIAHVYDYFNVQRLGSAVNLILMAGRDITAAVIDEYQPDALLIRSVTQVNADLLNNNDSVKFIGSATIGTDHVDQSMLKDRGIIFTNAAGCSKHSVAQYVMTAILTLRPEYWQPTGSPTPVKLGVIGLGNIGSTLTKYAQDLGWKVCGYDPLLPSSTINNASLDDVLTHSDVISLHVPLSTAANSDYPTHHLIDKAALAMIPSTTMLINSARGQVVSQSALLSEFAENPTKNKREVVLDVFEFEPVVAAKLLDNLAIATPHIAGYTLEGKLRGTQMVFDEFVRTFNKVLSVTQTQILNDLLPANPYHWQYLKANPDHLSKFYDIALDNQLLIKALANKPEVKSVVFDTLRKNYPLRREWLCNTEL